MPLDIFHNTLNPLGLDRFVAVDLETTGLDAQTERIIEIGAVRFIEGAEADKFAALVYPQKELPPEITRLTGISEADLKDAPYAQEVLPDFLKFLGKDRICAQNALFDITFLKVEFARLGEAFHPDRRPQEMAYDTAVLSRALIPELESHGLSRLADYFSIDPGDAHRAEDDARSCGKVLLKLAELLFELGVAESVSAGKILGPGVMGDMFRSLTRVLTESGASAERPPRKAYSSNILGQYDPEAEIESIADNLDEIFSTSGKIAVKMQNYEPRPKQLEMASDCADALLKGDFLMAEAGTGTGKSFAYLVPAILFSLFQKQRVVVTTNTKNLQEQLFSKDIPFLVEALPLKFQASLLKGRGNYLCQRKWKEVLSDPDYHLADEERTRVLPLLFWANRTTTGDIAENSGFRPGYLWTKFNSEAGACSSAKCSNFDECFLQKARQQAQRSHLVVVNHALVLSDIASDNAVLGEYNNLIVDEAHNLEKAASNYLGRASNIYKIRGFCFKLYRKDNRETGLLARLRKDYTGNETLSETIEKALLETNRILSAAGDFFGLMVQVIRSETPSLNIDYALKLRYSKGDPFINAGGIYLDDLLKGFKELIASLRSIAEALAERGEDVTETSAPGLETVAAADEAKSLVEDIIELYEADDPEWVYWWELPSREDAVIFLQSAPLMPGDILNEKMYPWLNSVIFTSATLTVAESFDYFKQRLGLDKIEDKKVITRNYGSPFDFHRQAVFAVPTFLPSPKESVKFTDELADLIYNIAREHRRGILALFTSYKQLEVVYNRIRAPLLREGINLIGQGIDGSRSDILRRFLSERAVLLGTDSFWEGIDAPGEALEILLVAKLPFDVPTEPLVQARVEKIENEGGNAFLEYTVPEAVIKLRQGIGRLIRSTADTGAVIICDNRVAATRWGGIFRNSLPGTLQVLRSQYEVNAAIGEILGD